ncbi:MAG: NAD(+) diphosphatase [Actinobacteria bacterium]|uniref:NAD(+) diphosphatase n=2 Tax=freshwater metagenome TaxID=449393 RepID=A0A6J7AIW4_9ZZZZ|nr:NAD(+) diphosphatase [Actinomycetota bacterium]MSW93173.1 NAD(+) diphosphatase [Actinomycetota bacterium]MSX87396.1 NAD(+) diphosphatase [Actinomycetota bacterium]
MTERWMSERWMIVRNGDVLVATGGAEGELAMFPSRDVLDAFAEWETEHEIGPAGEPSVWTVGVSSDAVEPDGFMFVPLRALHPIVHAGDWPLAGRAVQIVEWSRTHRFCGRCGTPTELARGERAMRCPACGLLSFPRLSPAVIMVVHRGDEMLLAHGRAFPSPMYSALAGFVEPGESLEEAVRREVREEVGVEVGDLRYFGSQPWPFPNSLMLGFYAQWESGEIVIDPSEIVDAKWFHVDELPPFPGSMSIASQLINGYIRIRRPTGR